MHASVQDPGRVAALMPLQAIGASSAGGDGVYDEFFNNGRIVSADEKCGQRGVLPR